MPEFYPDIRISTMPLPIADGICIRPPIIMHVPGALISRQSTSSATGHMVPSTGEIESQYVPLLQDTYKTGTSGRTGYGFTVESGTVYDDWKSPETNKYGLLFVDGRTDIETVVTQTEAVNFTPHRIVLTKQTGTLDSGKTDSDVYIILELNYGQIDGSIRLVLANTRPPCIETLNMMDGLVPWDNLDFYQVAALNEASGGADLFAANNGRLTIDVVPDMRRGILTVRFPKGYAMRYVSKRMSSPRMAADPNGYGTLPLLMKLRVSSKNGAASVEVYPLRWKPLEIKHHGPAVPQGTSVAKAKVRVNALGNNDQDIRTTASVTKDVYGNINVDATVDRSHADSLGASEPVAVSDMVIEIPGDYAYASPIGFWAEQIVPYAYTETQTWDDINRIATTTGTISFHNRNGRYANRVGNISVSIGAGNGNVFAQRCRGIAGFGQQGWNMSVAHPASVVTMSYADRMVQLQNALCQELVLDGLSVYTAVRLICLACGITPQWLANIPDDGYPPYPATLGFKPILGKGSGMSPRYSFGPQVTGMAALLEILQDFGFPTVTGSAIPYMFWFDQYGYANLMPWNPGAAQSKLTYSTIPNINNGEYLIESISVTNSIENLRTDVTVQGQDAYTQELIHFHDALTYNRGLVGYYRPAYLRSARFVSEAAVYQTANILARECSLSTTIVSFVTTFNPTVFAGDVITVYDPDTLMYPQRFTIMSISSELSYGNGEGIGSGVRCTSRIVARSIRNSLPLL